MRISWLEPNVVRITRSVMQANHPDWAVHFRPQFRAPAPPSGFDKARWPRIAEHVARAERVGQAVREQGLDAARERFGGSGHAIEQATLVSAAVQGEQLELEPVVELLECEVDDLVAYGGFLELLQRFRETSGNRALEAYESFCTAFQASSSDLPHWLERVRAVRDGLASFNISCGNHERGHHLFLERFQEEPDSVLVALAASRSFWSAGAISMTINWLDRGAERADELGRTDLAQRLRKKQDVLRARQS